LSKIPLISIIDDDDSVREAMQRLVRSLGYASVTFASAEEYLLSGRLRDTSCVITDVKMPGMSGVEMQNRLIANGDLTPVIFVTAFPEENIRKRVLESGASGFFSKPFDENCLISCLEKALESDHSRSLKQ
jgi:FixJ family two-component response regulator